MVLRNFMCGSLALAVIASGRVRRAKRRVLNSNVVTAIYFHNPSKRLFGKCVRWLTRNGYKVISAADLISILHDGAEPPRGAVWLSFDDGFKELLQNVIPLSRQCNIPITVFIPSGIVEGRGLFPWLHGPTEEENGPRDSVTKANVKEMARYPEVTIGSHTVGHIVTSNLSNEQTRFELGESRRVLEAWTGRAVQTFAYPEGRLSGREAHVLAEYGYQLAATTEARLVTTESNPYFVPRFHVGDNIPFPEAICNMVGMWRPAIDPPTHLLQSARDICNRLRRVFHSLNRVRSNTSV
jgi:peptidoglycan/xylan/chitin deacetylase (PgdA/CDA1 family)